MFSVLAKVEMLLKRSISVIFKNKCDLQEMENGNKKMMSKLCNNLTHIENISVKIFEMKNFT